jgi:hypothetical protein
MLTGILIEMALEPVSFDSKVYIKRLKATVTEMLYP